MRTPLRVGLRHSHQRSLELVQSDERKVPLSYRWVGDRMLPELIEEMARGDEGVDACPRSFSVSTGSNAGQWRNCSRDKSSLAIRTRSSFPKCSHSTDWSEGAGPKLKQILMRGIGVHHAGVLPRYKRIVEELYQRKLLMLTVCTETLAAGINLPARSVVLPAIIKGPKDKKKLIEPSAAHQMFGRAGRPQFDSEGFVYALAHEDDVKIHRWREKFEQIPEDTKIQDSSKRGRPLRRNSPKGVPPSNTGRRNNSKSCGWRRLATW